MTKQETNFSTIQMISAEKAITMIPHTSLSTIAIKTNNSLSSVEFRKSIKKIASISTRKTSFTIQGKTITNWSHLRLKINSVQTKIKLIRKRKSPCPNPKINRFQKRIIPYQFIKSFITVSRKLPNLVHKLTPNR